MSLNPIPIVAAIFVAAAVVRGGKKKKGASKNRPPIQDDELERGDLSPEDAIEQAIAEMQAGDTIDDAANRAYWIAYPECPEVLDPDNPDHDECIQLWLELRKAIDTAVSQGARIPGDECDPLDPSTWAEGTICVDTSGGWRALPKDEASGCKSSIFPSDNGKVWACLSDGSIEDVVDFADRGPFGISITVDDVVYVAKPSSGPKEGVDDVVITLRAPNPYGSAGVRALYLALSVKKEHPDQFVQVNLEPGVSEQGIPKYQVERRLGGSWVDEVWLPVDEGWDMNEDDLLNFAEGTY